MTVEKCKRCKKDGFFCEQGPTGSRTIINAKTFEWLDLTADRRIENCPTVSSPKGRHTVKKRENSPTPETH